MIQYIIFSVGLTIFVTYLYFLLRMINITHKQQEKEHGPNGNATTKEMVEKVLKSLEELKQ